MPEDGNHPGFRSYRLPLSSVSAVQGIPTLGMALQPGQAERLDEPLRLPLLLPTGWRKGRLPLRDLSALHPDEGAEGCHGETTAVAWGLEVKSLIRLRS